MTEIYKDLPGWEGIYRISDHGYVVSVDRTINGRRIRGRTLKPSSRNQTAKVNLCTGTGGISKTYTVGHLVLLAFVGEKPVGCRVQHRDGNFKNNALQNLYWGIHRPTLRKGGSNA